ncbi:MAG: NAD(P)H-binding protein, partial [Microcoleaceae cyanobacterium]
GTAESVVALSPQALQTLNQVLLEKEKAEKYLRDSGLNYTIIRPGGLKSEPATGKAILTENYRISGMIHRADVAQLVCDCFMSEKANGKTLSAVDPNQLFNTDTFDIFQP